MRYLLLAISLSGLLIVPAFAQAPAQLTHLKTLCAEKDKAGKISSLRPKAIEETAYALGVQHGVKWRYDQINTIIDANAGSVDTVFNFNAHLLHNGVMMPPIVVEAGPAQRLESEKLSVYTDTTYKIRQDARLLTCAPDWRAYLIQHHKAVIDVHPSLYPADESERAIWTKAVEKGWDHGVGQANYLFEQEAARLKRDIRGIIRYRILAMQGVVNVPLMATARTGAQISEKRRKLELSKTVVRMTKGVTFMEKDKWFPAAN
jgi:defect-in-organelle-trafficking protein DotC